MLPRQALKTWHWWVVKWLTSCCKSASTVPSVPADLNGINVLIAHRILDWSLTILDSSQSSMWAANAFRFGCHCPYKVTSPADPGKGTLFTSLRVSFPNRVYCPSCGLIDPTLLADWLAMILMSLVCHLNHRSPDSSPSKRTIWLFWSLGCNRWRRSFMSPSHLFF